MDLHGIGGMLKCRMQKRHFLIFQQFVQHLGLFESGGRWFLLDLLPDFIFIL